MQIVQDVTPPEFGRLLGKKLVLSRPYLNRFEIISKNVKDVHVQNQENIKDSRMQKL